jgi:hypothetical protein
VILCNECYKPIGKKQEAMYPFQWQHSGDMYCKKHETRAQFKQQKSKEKANA